MTKEPTPAFWTWTDAGVAGAIVAAVLTAGYADQHQAGDLLLMTLPVPVVALFAALIHGWFRPAPPIEQSLARLVRLIVGAGLVTGVALVFLPTMGQACGNLCLLFVLALMPLGLAALRIQASGIPAVRDVHGAAAWRTLGLLMLAVLVAWAQTLPRRSERDYSWEFVFLFPVTFVVSLALAVVAVIAAAVSATRQRRRERAARQVVVRQVKSPARSDGTRDADGGNRAGGSDGDAG